MRLSIQKSAIADLRRGFRFYEKQAPRLGSYFLNSLYSDIDSLVLHAGVHPIHFEKYFRVLSARFPFAVYYQMEGDLVRVKAVLDLRRDVRWIQRKMEDLS